MGERNPDDTLDPTGVQLTWGAPRPDDATDPPADGAVRLGRYVLRDKLGRGGMGLVYRAWDPELDREVALKLLFGGPLGGASQRQRFLREARAVARLRHPHIVEVYDIGEHEGSVFFTMRLIEGPTLTRRLKDGPMAEREAARLALQLARALAHAHARGFVHRDIKPGNVLLDGEDAVLVDFGLVKDPEESVALTQDGRAMGTPAYMSPEQARGDLAAVGPASDQYGLGAVLYEALSGLQPYAGATPLEVMRRITDEAPSTLERFKVDPGLARVVRRAMARAPRDRFRDMDAMAAALERWLAGGASLSGASDLTLRLRGAARRHRWPLLVLATALLVVAVVSGGGRLRAWRTAATREDAAEQRRAVLSAGLDEALHQGRVAEAERLHAAFALSPENQGTEALAAAWMDWGRRSDALGRPDDAREALGVAYVLSRQPDRQDDALVALARLFRAEDDFGRLASTVAVLEARGSARLAGPSVRELRRDLAVARGELAVALTLEPRPEDQALIRALSLTTPLDVAGDDAQLWDSDGDGRPELLVFQRAAGRLALLDPRAPGAPPLATGAAPPKGFRQGWSTLRLASDAPPLAMVVDDDACRLLAREGDALIARARLPCANFASAAAVDLDRDGRAEVYLSGVRDLHRIRPEEGWAAPLVPNTLNPARSLLRELTAADLDEDGRPELLVGAAEWNAYDLRALVPDGDALSLRARARLGEVRGLTTLTWAGHPAVAALQRLDPEEPVNRRAFGDVPPFTELRGIHVLRLVEQGFIREAVFRWPEPPVPQDLFDTLSGYASGGLVRAADLDGDGQGELVALPAPGWSWLFFRRADGTLGELALWDVDVLAAGDVDGDGDDELVVRSPEAPHRLSLVGVGDPAPLRPAAALGFDAEGARAPPPAELDAALQQRWTLAEDLVSIGLIEVAARQLLAATALATDPLLAGRLRLRAAALLERSGALEDALGVYERAAEEDALVPEALDGAYRCARADLRLERALRAGRTRLTRPDPPPTLEAEVRALAAWLNAAPQRFDFAQGIDPLWRVEDARALQGDAVAGGLRVRSADSTTHLSLPLRWGGGRKRLRVTLIPQRVDWGASLRLLLHPAGEAPVDDQALRVEGRGGGEQYALETFCPLMFVEERVRLPLPRGEGSAPMVIDWTVDPEASRASCTVTLGERSVRQTYALFGAPPADEALTLTLVTGSTGHTLYDALLQKIELWGAEPLPHAPTPAEAARRAFVMGHTAEALSLLEDAPRDDPGLRLLHALALAELGEGPWAEREIAALLRQHPEQRARLLALLVTAPERYAALLRGALGADYLPAFYEAHATLVFQHPREARVLAPLLIWLEGLSDVPPGGLSDEALEARIWLLARRGEAARRRGRLTEARRDLEQALALAETAPDTAWGWAPTTLPRAWSELALVRWALRDRAGAFDALERALAVAGAPEVFADILAVSPDFEALRPWPRWAVVEAARRRSVLGDAPVR
ncbi:MAG: protein kinase [Alphaproteobacteria bacterium]|nr:protein kinase [Alphaproteobacteria bacterium]